MNRKYQILSDIRRRYLVNQIAHFGNQSRKHSQRELKDKVEISLLKDQYNKQQYNFGLNKDLYLIVRRKLYFGIVSVVLITLGYNLYEVGDFYFEDSSLKLIAINKSYEKKLVRLAQQVIFDENQIVNEQEIIDRLNSIIEKESSTKYSISIIDSQYAVFKILPKNQLLVSKQFIHELNNEEINLLFQLERILLQNDYNRVNIHPEFTIKFGLMKMLYFRPFVSLLYLQNSILLKEYFFNPYKIEQLDQAINQVEDIVKCQKGESNQVGKLQNVFIKAQGLKQGYQNCISLVSQYSSIY